MKIKESVTIEDFKDFDNIISKHLPNYGQGDTKASQLVTAVNKIIYKWFNDGDVVDNVNTGLEGWANDLSSYANWLETYIPEAEEPLHTILWETKGDEDKYTTHLYELASTILRDEILSKYSTKGVIGDIYECDIGDFKWEIPTDEDDWEEEEEDTFYYDSDEEDY